ncbi:MAG: phosphoribosylformylglycinamidine cyclo-ligase [Synergistaceae bacterium]|jgi:phosphoribosylformylglycinamidine cyclo-ligase|nr:phosphoribosylformylglycinamidine cyclo-ligase [Synergistaceae bacterium]
MNYMDAGVDIDRGNAWIETIKRLVAGRGSIPKTGIGGFSGTVSIGGGRSIVACCDGVGTKIELARETGIYRGLGQDLVAMSVNDLVTCGATPLFFLDYIACGALDEAVMESVIEGVLDGCEASRCALLGGETAEMPGVYAPDGFDLAGFAVGLLDDDRAAVGRDIAQGDIIIGLPSSGIHSNGYSLVRKILRGSGVLDCHGRRDNGGQERNGRQVAAPTGEKPLWGGGATLGEILMRPTKIYARAALEASSTGAVKGMAHITGGGIESNINRVMPGGLKCAIDYSSWERPPVFDFIADSGVGEAEMRRVFNLGVGYAVVVSPSNAGAVVNALKSAGETPFTAGRVTETG